MNKFLKLTLGVGFSAFVLTGCATKEFVQEQIKPIKEKVDELDKRLTKVENDLEKLKQDTKANKDKIEQLEKDHKLFKDQIQEALNKSNEALNTAKIADKKADKNADDIKALEAQLKRTNENIQKTIEKGLRK